MVKELARPNSIRRIWILAIARLILERSLGGGQAEQHQKTCADDEYLMKIISIKI